MMKVIVGLLRGAAGVGKAGAKAVVKTLPEIARRAARLPNVVKTFGVIGAWELGFSAIKKLLAGQNVPDESSLDQVNWGDLRSAIDYVRENNVVDAEDVAIIQDLRAFSKEARNNGMAHTQEYIDNLNYLDNFLKWADSAITAPDVIRSNGANGSVDFSMSQGNDLIREGALASRRLQRVPGLPLVPAQYQTDISEEYRDFIKYTGFSLADDLRITLTHHPDVNYDETRLLLIGVYNRLVQHANTTADFKARQMHSDAQDAPSIVEIWNGL